MHGNVPVRFGRGRLDSLGNKGLAAYLIAGHFGLGAHVDKTEARNALGHRGDRHPSFHLSAQGIGSALSFTTALPLPRPQRFRLSS